MNVLTHVRVVVLACLMALSCASPGHAAAPVRHDSVVLGPLSSDASRLTAAAVARCTPTPGRFSYVELMVSNTTGGWGDARQQFDCTGRPQRLRLDLGTGVQPGPINSYLSWGTDCGVEKHYDEERGWEEHTICANSYQQTHYGPGHLLRDRHHLSPALQIDRVRLLPDGSVRVRGTSTCGPQDILPPLEQEQEPDDEAPVHYVRPAPGGFRIELAQGAASGEHVIFPARCSGEPVAFDARLRVPAGTYTGGPARLSVHGATEVFEEVDDQGGWYGAVSYGQVDLGLSVHL